MRATCQATLESVQGRRVRFQWGRSRLLSPPFAVSPLIVEQRESAQLVCVIRLYSFGMALAGAGAQFLLKQKFDRRRKKKVVARQACWIHCAFYTHQQERRLGKKGDEPLFQVPSAKTPSRPTQSGGGAKWCACGVVRAVLSARGAPKKGAHTRQQPTCCAAERRTNVCSCARARGFPRREQQQQK